MSRIGPLPDVLAPGLRVVFVGINPSLTSGRVGHHFASKGNPFWRLLHASGLTPVLLEPTEDGRAPELGLGLTNLCPRPTRTAAELTRAEARAGAAKLVSKLDALRPSVVALVGVTLARIVLPGSSESGPGPRLATVAGARVFVLPNPSGRNAAFPGFEAKLEWFVRLRELAGAQPEPVRERTTRRSRPPGRPPRRLA
ncbi:MAG TPA: mismatch-specific DNA-glycosylase [Anaeromyxobacter sp.]